MQDSFTVTQQLNFKAYLSATLYFYLTRKLTRRFFLILIAITFFSVILGITATSSGIDIISLLSSFIPVAILFVLLLVFAFVIAVKNYFTRPYLFKEITYSFTESGVTGNAIGNEFQMPWSAIKSFRETNAFFFLIEEGAEFLVIRKKSLTLKDSSHHFRQLVLQRIKPNEKHEERTPQGGNQ